MAGFGFRRDVAGASLDIEIASVRRVGWRKDEALERGSVGAAATLGTIVDIAAQNAAPTAAQIAVGFIDHASTSSAGTMTVPTGELMEAGFPGLETGDTIKFYDLNSGTQTVTLTGATGTTMLSAQTVLTLQGRLIVFVRTASEVFDVFGV